MALVEIEITTQVFEADALTTHNNFFVSLFETGEHKWQADYLHILTQALTLYVDALRTLSNIGHLNQNLAMSFH